MRAEPTWTDGVPHVPADAPWLMRLTAYQLRVLVVALGAMGTVAAVLVTRSDDVSVGAVVVVLSAMSLFGCSRLRRKVPVSALGLTTPALLAAGLAVVAGLMADLPWMPLPALASLMASVWGVAQRFRLRQRLHFRAVEPERDHLDGVDRRSVFEQVEVAPYLSASQLPAEQLEARQPASQEPRAEVPGSRVRDDEPTGASGWQPKGYDDWVADVHERRGRDPYADLPDV